MNCPNCGCELPASDVNIVRLVAKCKNCNEVFSFEKNVLKKSHEPPRMPSNIQTAVIGETFHIRYKWFSPKYIVLAALALLWDIPVFFVYVGMLLTPGPFFGKLLALLFPLVHLIIGVAITYAALCGLFNTTTISISPGTLGIRHAPFSWGYGNKFIPIDKIEQLFCKQETFTSKSKNGKCETHSYSLHASLTDGERIDLLTDLDNRDLVSYLEYAIEKHLGIIDRPVTGEMPKSF